VGQHDAARYEQPAANGPTQGLRPLGFYHADDQRLIASRANVVMLGG